MDKLVRDTNLAVVIATHSWREQFAEAVTINAGQSQQSKNQIKTPQAMIQGGPNPAIKNQHQGTEETLETHSGAKRSCSILHKFGVDVSINLEVSRAQVKGQQPALEPTFPLEGWRRRQGSWQQMLLG